MTTSRIPLGEELKQRTLPLPHRSDEALASRYAPGARAQEVLWSAMICGYVHPGGPKGKSRYARLSVLNRGTRGLVASDGA